MGLDVYLREDLPYPPTACLACVSEDPTHTHWLEHTSPIYQASITHNCTQMAVSAGIYKALWRPAELTAAPYVILEGLDVAAWERRTRVHARDLIETLTEGVRRLLYEPDHFKRLENPNGWGTYLDFVPWVRNYLNACECNPNAVVQVSR